MVSAMFMTGSPSQSYPPGRPAVTANQQRGHGAPYHPSQSYSRTQRVTPQTIADSQQSTAREAGLAAGAVRVGGYPSTTSPSRGMTTAAQSTNKSKRITRSSYKLSRINVQ